MRNASFLFYLLLVCALAACKKDNSIARPSAGYWNFKSTEYTAYTCSGDPSFGELDVYTGPNNGPNGGLTITFGNSAPFYGSDTGTFFVIDMRNGNFANGANQITIALSGLTGTYNTSGSNGSGGRATAHVSYSNGKVSVSGLTIEMVNVVPPYDSAILSLNVNQLQ